MIFLRMPQARRISVKKKQISDLHELLSSLGLHHNQRRCILFPPRRGQVRG